MPGTLTCELTFRREYNICLVGACSFAGCHMPYDSKAIANYFLDTAASSGQSLTQMKLQKLVYFAHGWHLGLVGEPLINEAVQAWSYGPVIMSLYKEFLHYGRNNINEKAGYLVRIGTDAFDFEVKNPSVNDYPNADSLKQFLDRIWNVYGHFSGIQLSNLTHAPGTPWDFVCRKYNGKIPRYETIPDEVIAEYFQKEAQRNEQSKT